MRLLNILSRHKNIFTWYNNPRFPQNHRGNIKVTSLQVALAIRRFAICGFDYPRILFNVLNLVYAEASMIIHGFCQFCLTKLMRLFVHSILGALLLSAVLIFSGLFEKVTLANNKGCLFFIKVI